MLIDTIPFVLLLVGTFCVAYFVAAIGPTGGLQLAVTSATVPAAYVIPLHAWISALSAVFRATALWRSVDVKYVLHFTLPSILATGLAVLVGQFTGYDWIKILIGLVIIAEGTSFLDRLGAIAAPLRAAPPVVAGAITGFVTAFIGASGPLLWTLTKDRFPGRHELSATHSACLIVQHLSKILLFGAVGFSIFAYWQLIAATAAASLLGTILGQRRLSAFSEPLYRRLLNVALVASGVLIVGMGVSAMLNASGG